MVRVIKGRHLSFFPLLTNEETYRGYEASTMTPPIHIYRLVPFSINLNYVFHFVLDRPGRSGGHSTWLASSHGLMIYPIRHRPSHCPSRSASLTFNAMSDMFSAAPEPKTALGRLRSLAPSAGIRVFPLQLGCGMTGQPG